MFQLTLATASKWIGFDNPTLSQRESQYVRPTLDDPIWEDEDFVKQLGEIDDALTKKKEYIATLDEIPGFSLGFTQFDANEPPCKTPPLAAAGVQQQPVEDSAVMFHEGPNIGPSDAPVVGATEVGIETANIDEDFQDAPTPKADALGKRPVVDKGKAPLGTVKAAKKQKLVIGAKQVSVRRSTRKRN